MNLYEYQAKELFSAAGIPVPKSRLINKLSELDSAIEEVGFPCMLKAQILRGNRGKAGLIQSSESKEDAREKTRAIFDSPYSVKSLLVEKKLIIKKELYLSMTIDPVSSSVMAMASTEGGMDIEEIALLSPEKIVKERINVFYGLMPFHSRSILSYLNLSKETGKSLGKIIGQLYKLFRKHDAGLAEINPLVVTADNTCMAADGKMIIDDNALYRQPFERVHEEFTNKVEYEAAQEGIPYLQFDGDIGLMCAGAGLTNAVYDIIHDYGGKPANFLEFGGPNYRKALQAMRLTLKSNPKVILIVTFGTIARADVMAQGIAEAIQKLKPKVPVVTAIRGTGEEDAAKILRSVGLEPLQDTEEAVKKAIALAEGVE